MRKTYIAPEMKVVEIKTAGMLAQSSFGLNSIPVGGGAALSPEMGGISWDDNEGY